jgi:ribosomal protein L37AE/L43A
MITIDQSWLTAEGKYQCPFCKKIYSKNGISTHIWKSHGNGKNHKPFLGRKPWNEGLNAKTDERIRKGGEKISFNQTGSKNHFYGKKHKPETISKMKANPNMGGAGRGGGRGKAGWYKGYWCDSSWELAYVIYNIDHDIEFKRNKEGFSYIHENIERKYYPDFIEDDAYVEIKGYYDDSWISKINSFKQNLKILYKKDMKKYIDYVIIKYGKDFTNLYDNVTGPGR